MGDLPFAAVRHRPEFERRWHVLQRVIEIAVVVVVLLGLAGLLGTGPLSTHTEALAGIPMTATYDWITRRTLQSEIVLQTTAPLDHVDLEVELPTDFVRTFDITSTSPRSSAMKAGPRGVSYTFDFRRERQGEVRLAVKARSAGIIDATLRAGAGSMKLRVLVLP